MKKLFLLLGLYVVALGSRLNAQTFNATGGNQTYTITATGTLTLTARGADGASAFVAGGSGATVQADFPVLINDELIIVAGKAGVGNLDGDGFGGGGGGSAVILKRGGTSTLLIVAGAGGGSSGFLITRTGKGGSAADGSAGGGTVTGSVLTRGGTGGGGFNAAGSSITAFGSVAYTGGEAGTLTGGGAGGAPQFGPFAGVASGGFGFGGGGSGNTLTFSGGGGGGYGGGNGGFGTLNFTVSRVGGSGGTSFIQTAGIAGTNSVRTNGTDGGGTGQDGLVELNFVCGAAAPDLFTSFAPNQPVPGGQTSVSVCQNVGNVTFQFSNCIGGTVDWTGNDGTSGTGNIIAPTDTPGAVTYSATCTLDGCTSEASEVTVTTNAPPTASISGSTAVVLGFGSNCTTLTANPSGTAPFTYQWRMGSNDLGTEASQQVCPETNTTYSLTVTDANGCSATEEVTVNVQDVRCGPGNKYVTVCYYGTTQCVREKTAKNYLRLGATLGACGSGGSSQARLGTEETAAAPLTLSLKAFPNPVQDVVTLEVMAPNAGMATFRVIDLTGHTRQSRTENLVEGLNQIEFRLGTLPTGVYLIRTMDGFNRQGVVKVSKE